MNADDTPSFWTTYQLTFPVGVVLVLFFGIGLPLLGSAVSLLVLAEWHWDDQSFHMLIEILGGLLALLLGALLQRQAHLQAPQLYYWVSCGLMAMGILDIFHALVEVGKIFVWFHSAATFIGGVCFMMGGYRLASTDRPLTFKGPLWIGLLSTLGGVLSLAHPEMIPMMVSQGEFTGAARGLNILGGLGFFLTAVRFIQRFRASGGLDEWFFAVHCTLFGSAGVLFELSSLWDASWWWWHFLRLLAYGTGLQCVFAMLLRQRASNEKANLTSIDKGREPDFQEAIKKKATYWFPMMIVGIVVSSLITGGRMIYLIHDHFMENEGRSLSALASLSSQRLTDNMFERKGDIQLLAQAPVFRTANADEMSRYLKKVARTYQAYLALSFVNAQGVVVASSSTGLIQEDLAGESIVEAMRQTPGFHFADVERVPTFMELQGVALASPVFLVNGQYHGMVLGYVGIPYLQGIVTRSLQAFVEKKEEVGSTFEWQLLKEDGTVITDSKPTLEQVVNLRTLGLPSANLIGMNAMGYVKERHLRRDVAVISGYAGTSELLGLPGKYWGVLMRRDQETTLASLKAIEAKLGLAGLVVVLPLIGLILASVHRMEKAQTITTYALQMAESSATQTRLILDSAAEGIYGLDVHGQISFVNPSACRMLGYHATELIGNSMHAIVHHSRAEGEPYPRSECPMHCTAADEQTQRGEDEILWRKDGTSFPIAYTSTPIVDVHGQAIGAVVTFQDITERKQHKLALQHHLEHLEEVVANRTQDLAKAKERAEGANRAKSEFLANMTHELRTPMHAILSFASLAISRFDRSPREKLLSYVTQIQQSGTRLLGLVNDLLDLSRLEAGKMPLQLEDIDLKELVFSMKAQINALIQEKEIKISYEHETDETSIVGDRQRLNQVLWNLVSNAAKFSPVRSRILIGIREVHVKGTPGLSESRPVPGLKVTVRDAGPGIPEEELMRIFEKFEQSSLTNTGAGGTGLGLAICREIVELHGGMIWAENHPEQGAMFHFAIPRKERKMNDQEQVTAHAIKA
ncbi:MAG: ATP-binding protein [Nitrospirales bacterium]|nr:PAS domain S-box protein [Nitrospira sp.]MDR4502295.1 ATP-binding protein [Nitrospirales bacterium]